MSSAGASVVVVMVTWKGTNDTIEAIDSLRRSTTPRVPVVLIDNGSSEAEKAPLRRLSGVRLIELESNIGVARAQNIGIDYALKQGATSILLLNNDTLVEPQMLENLVKALAEQPAVGIVAPKMYYSDPPNLVWFAGGRLSLWRGDASHIGMDEYDSGQHSQMREIDYASSCAMLMRRSLVEQVGSEDPAFFVYFSETDYCLRSRRLGWRIMLVPDAVVWHKVSRAVGSGTARYWSEYTKSRLLFIRKHASVAQKLTSLAYLSLIDTPRLIGHFVRRRKLDCVKPYLNAIYDGLTFPLASADREQS